VASIDPKQLSRIEFANAFDFLVRLHPKGEERNFLQGKSGPGNSVAIDWTKWLPVRTVTYPIAGVETETINYPRSVDVPVGGAAEQVVIEFYDSAMRHIHKYLQYWAESGVFDARTHTVGCIKNISRQLDILEFAPGQEKPVMTTAFWVYPKGEIPKTLTSDGNELLTYSITFAVTGKSHS